MSQFTDAIPGRKSVRTFDGAPLRPEDREKLEKYMKELTNPFGIPVECVLLDADKEGLSSPVIAGETLYVAGMVEKKPYADVAFGVSFEMLVLYAWSLGIGTTWIAGTMKRDKFEAAAGLKEGWMMPCISPLGYPAKKRSLKESMMRKGVGADSRLPAEKLFFDGSFDKPLAGEKLAALGEVPELVRWAPSAVNKQPWRLVAEDGRVHFYEKKDKGYVGDATGDLQKIDVGIALSHLLLGLEARGKNPSVTAEDPGIPVPADTEYIVTVAY